MQDPTFGDIDFSDFSIFKVNHILMEEKTTLQRKFVTYTLGESVSSTSMCKISG